MSSEFCKNLRRILKILRRVFKKVRRIFGKNTPYFLISRAILWQSRRLSASAPNLFAEIRKNICGKTRTYFGKNACVFAEINLKAAKMRPNARLLAHRLARGFGKMHVQISVSSNLTWIAPSNALGCYCHTHLDASIPRACKEASKFPCTVVQTHFHAGAEFIRGKTCKSRRNTARAATGAHHRAEFDYFCIRQYLHYSSKKGDMT